MEKVWWYYLHSESKNLIAKRTEPEADSPFVTTVWRIDLTDRLTAWKMILEALNLGAYLERVKELATKWNMTQDDAYSYMIRTTSPSPELRQGMRLFVAKVLGMDMEAFLADFGPWSEKLANDLTRFVKSAPVNFEHTCPHCGQRHRYASPDEEGKGPRDGDYAICSACGELSVFESGITRKPTAEEKRASELDPKITVAIDMLRRRRMMHDPKRN